MGREKTLKYKTPEWLSQRGCAHDFLEEQSAVPAAVEIWVDPNGWLFRAWNVQPAFFVWVEVAARNEVHIDELSFELRDFPDVQFSLLPCPEKREPYSFPGGAYVFEQKHVLNKAFPGILRRNYPRKGHLLGVAFKPLPAGLFGRLPAEVKAWDEFGSVVGSAQFEIAVLPEKPCKRNISKERKSIFDPLETEEEGTGPEVPLPRKPLIVPGIVNELTRHQDRASADEGGSWKHQIEE